MDKRKRLKKRNRRRKSLFNAILLIGLSSLFIYFLLNSSLFEIKLIKVTGNRVLGKDEIIGITKIYKGENIFRIKASSLEKDLLKEAYIKEAEIKRSLPNIITIGIREREEKIQVKYISSFIITDIDGVVLDHREEINEDMLFVRGIDAIDTNIGSNIFINFENQEIKDFFTSGESLGLLIDVQEINMESTDNITIRLNNGLDIDFGPIDNVKYKLSLISEVIKDNSNQNKKLKRIIMNKGTHPILVLDE